MQNQAQRNLRNNVKSAPPVGRRKLSKPKTWIDKSGRNRGGATYVCPNCGGLTRVLRTKRDDKGRITRHRTCRRCHKDFWTKESVL